MQTTFKSTNQSAESKSYSSNKSLRPREAREMLRPYLDFANMFDPSRDIRPPWVFPNGGLGDPLSRELLSKVRERFPIPSQVLSKMKKRGRGYVAGWIPDPSAREGGWRLPTLTLFEDFYAIREALRQIATQLSDSPNRPIFVRTPMAHILRIRADGTLQRSGVHDGLLGILQCVDARRIRICPVSKCGRLFFAWRRDKGACSTKCCNIWNVLKSRSPEKAVQYKIGRIRNAEAREGKS
jgi:hypothetical protein